MMPLKKGLALALLAAAGFLFLQARGKHIDCQEALCQLREQHRFLPLSENLFAGAVKRFQLLEVTVTPRLRAKQSEHDAPSLAPRRECQLAIDTPAGTRHVFWQSESLCGQAEALRRLNLQRGSWSYFDAWVLLLAALIAGLGGLGLLFSGRRSQT